MKIKKSKIQPDFNNIFNHGDIAFYHDHTLFGWIIRKVTNSSWNHVAIIVKLNGRFFIIESTIRKGVSLVLLSDSLPDLVVRREGLQEESLEWAFERLTASYSILDAIRAGIGLRTKERGWICSEFVGGVLKHEGMQISEWGMTPQAIFDLFPEGSKVLMNTPSK